MRHHNFTSKVKEEALFRQGGLCAHCGEPLDDLIDRAHHVVPDQASRGKHIDAFLGTVDNCVYLCLMCHDVVHAGGRMRDGAVAPPSYYRHSHKDGRDAHNEWVARLDRLIRSRYNESGPLASRHRPLR
ncbi:UNVERIFIED_ORG: hypothetical protein M2193_008438 [Bradyrhizobium japonicum]|uniref:HNH endonuclease n=1 Tax=Bradyrhizobium diazoefficiens TaxID=1355477 RepID=UPI00346D5926